MQTTPYVIQAEDALGNKLYYNTLTQAFVRMSPTTNVDALTPDTEAALASLSILTDYPDEEPRLIEEHYAIDTKSSDALTLLIAPTLACNFACPYCYEAETRHAGIMDAKTQNDLVAFAKREIANRGYRELQIKWYGGEPLLGIGAIEALTPRLKSLGVPYTAGMISNLSLASDDVVERIVSCGITSVMTTLDGIGTRHDCHRPSVSGAPSYERIRSAIDALSERGVMVTVLYNLDRTNGADFETLDKEFYGRENVMFIASQIFDYCGRFEKADDFRRPDYDLFDDPEENANLQYERFLKMNPGPTDFAAQVAPIHVFCGRQVEGYFVVDEKGMLYECDGDIGYYELALGSLTDDPAPAHKPYNPLTDKQCKGCAFVPLCLGNCRRLRDHAGQSCIPFKWIAGRLLSDWSACFAEPLRSEAGVEVLNEPQSLTQFYAEPQTYRPL